MSNPILSIIVLSYNTQDLTVQTLRSIFKSIQKPTFVKKVEVLVVDNASTDGSVAAIQKLCREYSSIKLIKSKTNLGFGRGNNLGLKQAQGKYILFLNSDTIVQPRALELLVQTFESNPVDDLTATTGTRKKVNDRIGILAAQLLNIDGTIQPQGGRLPNLLTVFNQLFFLDDLPLIGRFLPTVQETGLATIKSKTESQLIPKGWVGGTAMIMPKRVLDHIGGFDPNIFMYSEDVEICLRAFHHGYDVAVLPQAKITHLGSASSSNKNAIMGEIKGYVYIWAKHFPHWQGPILKQILKISLMFRQVVFKLFNQVEKAKIYSEISTKLNNW